VDQLGVIRCPVLVVAADEDYTPIESKAAYVKLLPQGEMVVIEDSRHATPVEKPEVFNRVIIEFLDQHG
jgi:pimeloyl-ACP methyl ester carboxylesterase